MPDPLDWLTSAAALAEPEKLAPRRPRTVDDPSTSSTHPMAWADHATCRGMDTDLFYPGRGEEIATEAVDACRICTVRPDCLEWALRHERHGFWAGESERGRRRLRRTLGIRLADDDPATDSAEDLAS